MELIVIGAISTIVWLIYGAWVIHDRSVAKHDRNVEKAKRTGDKSVIHKEWGFGKLILITVVAFVLSIIFIVS